VRSIVCRYDTAGALGAALESAEHELAVPQRRPRSSDAPESSRGIVDGEWVLAIVELGGQATAAAARVRRHEGALTLAFEPRDWVRLHKLLLREPATDRSPQAAKSNPPASSFALKKLGDAGGARILLVDDDTEVREVVSAMLEAVGFAVSTVESAEHGLKRLEVDTFDLVVLDWTLPGMTGLELCRTIRAKWSRLPVLFLTANATTDVVDAFAGGADDYVVKPFRAPELGARIFGLLRRRAGPT
jgi:two-component system phosphate regulon response regulator PhoB